MYVILVYDVNEKRVAKALKVCRKYLYWIQNSVFEGEITEAKLEKLKYDLKKVIKEAEDSVIIYKFKNERYTERQTMGVKKGGENLII